MEWIWESSTPEVSSARRKVGTRASRWAREATSGTTPPKRACSSTLDATSSASSSSEPSWPSRTMPKPVSSHELSMPRMSLSDTLRGPSHRVRVGTRRLVVAAAQAEVLEAVRQVHRDRRLVVRADLEVDRHVDLVDAGQQVREEHLADAPALPVPDDRDRVHAGLVLRSGEPRVADELAVRVRAEVVVAVVEFAAERVLAPRVLAGEQGQLDLVAPGHVGVPQRRERDGAGGHALVTRLRAAGSDR